MADPWREIICYAVMFLWCGVDRGDGVDCDDRNDFDDYEMSAVSDENLEIF